MTVLINGMLVTGTVDEIRELVSNPPSSKNEASHSRQSGTVIDQHIDDRVEIIGKAVCHTDDKKSVCPFGEKHMCERCKNGYCTATIYTSYPPKYRRCSFCDGGVDFKPCAEV